MEKVILYSSQSNLVIDEIEKNGVNYVKFSYIEKKYEEVSGVFLRAYKWYSENAAKIVERPSEAESGIWAFRNLKNLETHKGSKILKLEIPVNEIVFFDMMDWNKVLNMQYIGLSKAEEDNFRNKLSSQGINSEMKIFETSFYPALKAEILKSHKNLFRYHEKIKSGEFDLFPTIQGGLWKISRDWIVEKIS